MRKRCARRGKLRAVPSRNREWRREPINIVVIGASAGLGRAAAVEFAKRGHNLALVARDAERLAMACGEVEAAGGNALALPLDVANADAVAAAANDVVNKWGCIDIWVNCAMATIFAPLHEITPAEFRRATEVTYLGYVFGTMAALKHMRKRNCGTIVQVGSALSYRSIPLQSPYCGAKFAIRGFTDALRSELIHHGSGVRLTMVQMPALNTPQFQWARNRLGRRVKPLGPVFQPEVGARAIVRAASEAPRELWVGRSTLEAILGAIAVPGILDRYLARNGYEGQMSSEIADPAESGNLFSAVAGSFGAHGRFDSEALDGRAVMLDPSIARTLIGLGALAALVGSLIRRRPRRSSRLKRL